MRRDSAREIARGVREGACVGAVGVVVAGVVVASGWTGVFSIQLPREIIIKHSRLDACLKCWDCELPDMFQ